MIAFAKSYLRKLAPKPRFRLPEPGRTLIFMGCRRESIDAEFDRRGRMTCLIVHTRQRE